MNQVLLLLVLLVLTIGCFREEESGNLQSGIEVLFPIKKLDYSTSENGVPDKSQDLVKKLVHEQISHIEIRDDQVWIICKTDTLKAKAGEIHSYCEGDMVQNLGNRQRLDFMIEKLNEDSVSCKYFYVFEIEDEYLNESGAIILKSKN
jgi:hypothetical protein